MIIRVLSGTKPTTGSEEVFFFADGASVSGTAHAGCDDAQSAFANSDGAVTATADGCSTDPGSRRGAEINTAAALKVLRPRIAGVQNQDDVVSLIGDVKQFVTNALRSSMPFADTGWLATLACAGLNRNIGFAYVWGDGGVAVVKNDGSMDIYRIEWRGEQKVFYPSYATSEGSIAKFVGDNADAALFDIEDGDGNTISHTIAEGIEGVLFVIPDVSNVKAIFALSDGFEQIKGIGWKQALARLVSISKPKEDAIQALFRKLFGTAGTLGEWTKDGTHTPVDDTTVGAVMRSTARRAMLPWQRK